jgi:WD40 repeat protein
MEARSVHPAADLLRALGSGRCDRATVERVLAHLDGCPECRQAAAALLGDGALTRLRAGSPTGHTMPEAPADAVLPELRDHPQYEVLRELGRGGMGVVYLARNRLTCRLEALKVVNPRLFDEPGMADRFLREIRSAARLDHPNIVKAYTALQAGPLVIFAMEYVEGQDLGRLVKERGTLPVTDACSYARQAALALQHAFEKGMVHRDIKPHNLIRTHGGAGYAIKVLDFGLAKVTRESEETGHHLTGTGALLGTPEYIAPEQTLDAARADIRADVYSLGYTLYFLLAGSPPFRGRSQFELLQAHHTQEPMPLDQVRPDVPADLAAVVARMMAKDPARRYQKPAEVALVVEPFIHTGVGSALAPGGTTEVPPGAGPEGATPPLRATLVEGRDTMARATTPPAEARSRPSAAPGRRRWLPWAAVAVLLVAGGIGLLTSHMLRLHTPEGILVVEVNEANPDVYVDGDKVSGPWTEGGKTVVLRLRPGTRRLELKKDGFSVFAEAVELQDGQHHVLTARLVPAPDNSTDAYEPTGGERFAHFGPSGPRVVLHYTDYGARGDGKRVLASFFVRVYDLGSGTPVTPPLRLGGPVHQATFSPDGKLLVASNRYGDESGDGDVRVWDTGTEKLLFPPLHINGRLGWCAFSPDGKRLVTTSSNTDDKKGGPSQALLWDATTGKELTPPLKHGHTLLCACFSRDGKRVVTAGTRDFNKKEGKAQVWDAGTGQAITPPLLHDDDVRRATFSPDGRRVVTVSWLRARIWDAASGKELTPPLEQAGTLFTATFSPNGQRVVTAGAGADKAARVWDAATGQGVTPWLRHDDQLMYATFSSDGQRVVTAGASRTARVWDATTGRELIPPLKHEGSVTRALFSPGGKQVVTLSQGVREEATAEVAQLCDAYTGQELKKVTITPD